MPLKAVLKLINMFLALGVFVVIAANSVLVQDELILVVVRAVGCFIVCWIALGWLAGILVLVVQSDEPELKVEAGKEDNGVGGSGAKEEKTEESSAEADSEKG